MQRDNLPNPYIPTTMRKCKCYNNAQKNNKGKNIKFLNINYYKHLIFRISNNLSQLLFRIEFKSLQ